MKAPGAQLVLSELSLPLLSHEEAPPGPREVEQARVEKKEKFPG